MPINEEHHWRSVRLPEPAREHPVLGDDHPDARPRARSMMHPEQDQRSHSWHGTRRHVVSKEQKNHDTARARSDLECAMNGSIICSERR